MRDRIFFCGRQDEIWGPYSEQELQQWYRERRMTSDTRVYFTDGAPPTPATECFSIAELLTHNGYGAPFSWFDRKEKEEKRWKEQREEEELRQRICALGEAIDDHLRRVAGFDELRRRLEEAEKELERLISPPPSPSSSSHPPPQLSPRPSSPKTVQITAAAAIASQQVLEAAEPAATATVESITSQLESSEEDMSESESDSDSEPETEEESASEGEDSNVDTHSQSCPSESASKGDSASDEVTDDVTERIKASRVSQSEEDCESMEDVESVAETESDAEMTFDCPVDDVEALQHQTSETAANGEDADETVIDEPSKRTAGKSEIPVDQPLMLEVIELPDKAVRESFDTPEIQNDLNKSITTLLDLLLKFPDNSKLRNFADENKPFSTFVLNWAATHPFDHDSWREAVEGAFEKITMEFTVCVPCSRPLYSVEHMVRHVAAHLEKAHKPKPNTRKLFATLSGALEEHVTEWSRADAVAAAGRPLDNTEEEMIYLRYPHVEGSPTITPLMHRLAKNAAQNSSDRLINKQIAEIKKSTHSYLALIDRQLGNFEGSCCIPCGVTTGDLSQYFEHLQTYEHVMKVPMTDLSTMAVNMNRNDLSSFLLKRRLSFLKPFFDLDCLQFNVSDVTISSESQVVVGVVAMYIVICVVLFRVFAPYLSGRE